MSAMAHAAAQSLACETTLGSPQARGMSVSRDSSHPVEPSRRSTKSGVDHCLTMLVRTTRTPAARAWGWVATAVCMAHLMSATSAQQTGCNNLVVNGGFELNTIAGGFARVIPTGWTRPGLGGIVIVRQNTTDWGGLDSGSGLFYVGIQSPDTELTQSIVGLSVGSPYTLRIKMAERPGFGTTERITVTMGGVTILANIDPSTAFVEHTVAFQATATTATLQIRNTTPRDGTSDFTVFVDDVSICAAPTAAPTRPPTRSPTTRIPTTQSPTSAPTTADPTPAPTLSPTGQSNTPIDCTNLVTNGNFELNNIAGGFAYATPIGWTQLGESDNEK
eukprot:m.94574 g.94574  ORF g.94574 m.94574 type:complete len:333 (-) comp20375_c3_seq1:473-1471(-)